MREGVQPFVDDLERTVLALNAAVDVDFERVENAVAGWSAKSAKTDDVLAKIVVALACLVLFSFVTAGVALYTRLTL